MGNLNEKDWKAGIDSSEKPQIIDVRTPEEFNSGYIEGAKLIDIQESGKFMEEIENLPKDNQYYVYCRSGKRSGMACELMNRAGIKNTYNLEGGIIDWTGEIKED